tara:strand:+ start:218 stop:1564 length:1347 start_codon:yes stop_codon:yes gene_type:complete
MIQLTQSQAIKEDDNIQKVIVGQPIPNFSIDKVDYYSQKQLSSKALKGQWYILDFWGYYCLPCIKSFPKMNVLQEKFKDKIKVFLVADIRGKDGFYPQTQELFNKLKAKYNLNLSVAYDKVLMDDWKIYGVPHSIVVDDKGIVRAVMAGEDLNEEKLNILLEGGNPKDFKTRDHFSDKENLGLKSYNPGKLLLVDGNGGKGNDFLFRSLLSLYNHDDNYYPGKVRFKNANIEGTNTFLIMGAPLGALYHYAFFGNYISLNFPEDQIDKIYKEPVLEIKDSTLFTNPYKLDKHNRYEKLFNYSYSTPYAKKGGKEYLMEVMQRDLKNYFDFDVAVERRLMPCWKLISLSENTKTTLKTKGGNTIVPEVLVGGFTLNNISVDYLLKIIPNGLYIEEPVFNETGIEHNIDITLDAILTDYEDVIKALRKNGLDLVKTKKMVRVLVIKDSKK